MSVILTDRDNQSQLVERARDGDVAAFGELYDLHQARVYRMLVRLTRSHTLAEDLTSETFLRALRGLRTSQVQGDYVHAWLLRIARNLAVDYVRTGYGRLEVPVDPHDHLDLHDGVMGSAETEALSSFQRIALLRAVNDLPANQRACITARFLDDLSIAETSALLGCTEGAVKQLQYRGLRNLAQVLDVR